MKLRVHTEYSIASGGYSMAVIQEDIGRDRLFLQPSQWMAFERGRAVPHENAFFFTDVPWTDGITVKEFLQAMIDAAWDMGIRPKQMQAQTDELAAVRYHLEDMRKLVFDPSLELKTVER